LSSLPYLLYPILLVLELLSPFRFSSLRTFKLYTFYFPCVALTCFELLFSNRQL
jgi:hypothetical protein